MWFAFNLGGAKGPLLAQLAGLLLALFAPKARACFPLYGGGTCGGGVGGGTFCPPSYSAPPAYSYQPSAELPGAYPSAYPSPYDGYGQVGQPYHASKSRTMASSSSDHSFSGPRTSLASCLRRFPDTRLACALPFERRTPSDERECQRHCLDASPRCRSFQFDPTGSVCDLFEHTLASEFVYGTSTMASSPLEADGWKGKAAKAKGKRRERRFVLQNGVPLDRHSQSMVGASRAAVAGVGLAGTSSSSSPSNCVPSLESRASFLFVGLEPSCDSSSFAYMDDEELDDFPPPSPSPASPTLGQLEPMPSKPSAGRRTERVEAREEMLDCMDGARARVQLIDGIALVGQKQLVAVQLDSADVCLHVCRQNAHLDGLPFPSQCRSATFHRQSGRCEILGEAISPNGPLQYVPNPDSLYFEKMCFPQGDLPLGCDDVIHRIPQHHLDPRRVAGAGTVISASSQLECIRRCISAKARLGFPCASASFFFDWPSQNCFLSRFTRLSRPDMYAAERKEFVDYLEMPPCFQLAGIRQHDSPASGWSACIGGKRWRKRANCTSSTGTTGAETNCTESEECSTGVGGGGAGHGPPGRQVAPSIEVAKRFRPPAVASEEASLFGEQDYANQKEISFFGPPHSSAKSTEPQMDEAESQNEVFAVESSAVEDCDPRVDCCTLEELNGPKGIVRGCSLGKREMADGRTVSCVPDKCQ